MKKIRSGKFHKLDGIILLLLCACIGIFIYYHYCVNIAKSKEYLAEYNYFSTMDTKGNQYIVSNSKNDLLKVSKDGKIEFFKTSNDHDEGTFYEANEIAIDMTGNILVHDVVWNEDGLTIGSENILMYDADGNYIATVFEHVNESNVKRRKLFGLTQCKDGVYFIQCDTNQFKVYKVGSDYTCEVVNSLNFDDIESVQNATISYDLDGIYYVTKGCDIYQYDFSNTRTCIYEGADSEYIVPFYLQSGKDGNLYFSDIGNGDIYCINEMQTSIVLSGSEMSEWTGQNLKESILQTISTYEEEGRNCINITYDTVILNVDLENHSYEVITDCPFSTSIRIRSILWVIDLILLIIFGLYLAVRGCVIVLKGGYLKRQTLTIAMVLSIVVTSVIIIPYLLKLFRNIYVDSQVSQMCKVAQIAADMMDSESLDEVVYPNDYGNSNYQRVRDCMESVVNSKYEWNQGMYLNVAKRANDRYYSIAYLDNSIGGYYPIASYEAEEIDYVYDEKNVYINNGMSDSTGAYLYVKYPVKNEKDDVVGVIEVGMVLFSLDAQIAAIYQKLTISIALVIIIAIFLLNEFLVFKQRKSEFKDAITVSGHRNHAPIHLLRLCILLCFFAFNMPTSFIPVYLASLYDETVPFSKEIAGSLPLTISFVIMGIVSLTCSRILQKFSFRKVLMGGAFLSLIGDLSLALAENYWMGFAAMFFNGVGVGIIISSLYVCAAQVKDEDEKRNCFANMNGAELSGLVSGMVIGAALAQSFEQQNSFYFSSCVWVVLIFLFFILGKYLNTNRMPGETEAKTVKVKGKFKKFILSRQIIGFILLMQIPYAIVNGFTYYFVPVFGDANGLGEKVTSLILVLNSLTGVFFSVSLTDLFVRKLKRFSMYLASFISLVVLILFAYFPNLTILIVSVFLIGFAKSFGTTARNDYFCEREEVGAYGEDNAIGVYNLMDSVGDSIGTTFFGYIYGAGMTVGLTALAAVSTFAIGVYEVFIGRKGKKENKNKA